MENVNADGQESNDTLMGSGIGDSLRGGGGVDTLRGGDWFLSDSLLRFRKQWADNNHAIDRRRGDPLR